jgi:hypothetical protein
MLARATFNVSRSWGSDTPQGAAFVARRIVRKVSCPGCLLPRCPRDPPRAKSVAIGLKWEVNATRSRAFPFSHSSPGVSPFLALLAQGCGSISTAGGSPFLYGARPRPSQRGSTPFSAGLPGLVPDLVAARSSPKVPSGPWV